MKVLYDAGINENQQLWTHMEKRTLNPIQKHQHSTARRKEKLTENQTVSTLILLNGNDKWNWECVANTSVDFLVVDYIWIVSWNFSKICLMKSIYFSPLKRCYLRAPQPFTETSLEMSLQTESTKNTHRVCFASSVVKIRFKFFIETYIRIMFCRNARNTVFFHFCF